MDRRFFNKFNKGTSNFVTAGMQLKYIADYKPDTTAIICIDKKDNVSSITWRELFIQSNKLAWMLKEKKIGQGSIVMVALPNSIEHIVATFAIWKVGACYLPVSSKSAKKELIEITNMISPDIAFSEFEVPGTALTLDIEAMYKEMEEQPEHMPEDIQVNPNMISLSGGTTGKPKLISQNIPSGITDETFMMWFQMSGMGFEQRQLLVGPLFHGAPHAAAFNGLYSGNTLIIPRNLCPCNIVRLIKKYKVEYMQSVPILLNRITRIPTIQKEDFSSLKAICHTSGYCSDALKETLIDLIGAEKVYEIYSMTEIIGLTCIRGDQWLKHRGSIGLPVGEGNISIRDNEGKELPTYTVGEIYMTSPGKNFNTKYMNKDQLKVTADGFRSVGDLGYVDDEGYLYFVDRRNDMLVTGGENVFVNEVESALLRHKYIMDAVVIGIPDEEWGRRIHSIIESKEIITEEELKKFLKQYLSPYKIPKSFEFVSNIVRNDSGKVDREQMLKECVCRGV